MTAPRRSGRGFSLYPISSCWLVPFLPAEENPRQHGAGSMGCTGLDGPMKLEGDVTRGSQAETCSVFGGCGVLLRVGHGP